MKGTKSGCLILIALTLVALYSDASGADFSYPGWLNGNKGYSDEGDVRLDETIKYASNMQYSLPNDKDVGDSICRYGPQVLNLSGHFVVAIGEDVDTEKFKVIDPGHRSITTVTNYKDVREFESTTQKEYKEKGYYLEIHYHSPGELVLTDTQDRKVGYDPIASVKYDQIPEGFYGEESIDDLETGEKGPITKFLRVGQPVDGNYKLEVIGTGYGDYTLEMVTSDVSRDIDHFEKYDLEKEIAIIPGATHTYGFAYEREADLQFAMTAVDGNFDGKGQRPTDVNKFLSYVTPVEASTNVIGSSKYTVVVIYDKNILPGTFSATLNGVDVKNKFKPAPGGIESVSLDLEAGRNTLVLSVDGTTPGRTATDTDRLVFIVN